jgi:hypothetical protein
MKFRLSSVVSIVLLGSSFFNAQALDEFVVEHNGVDYSCSTSGSRYEVGQLLGGGRVASLEKRIRKIRLALEAAEGAKKTSLLNKLKSLIRLKREVVGVCKEVVPPVSATPTPTSTPTSGTSGGNFDAQGNVTVKGMAIFMIPAGLGANIERGKLVYDLNCTGCHVAKTGRPFTTLRTKIAEAPMDFDSSEIPDASLADLTAYLNRFRP